MSYITKRPRKAGGFYLYRQTSRRVGKKVKTISEYLGIESPLFGNSASDGVPLTDEEMIWRGWITKTTEELQAEDAQQKAQKDSERLVQTDGERSFLNPATASPSSEPPSSASSDTPASESSSEKETPSS
jgi:hypothetical protein